MAGEMKHMLIQNKREYDSCISYHSGGILVQFLLIQIQSEHICFTSYYFYLSFLVTVALQSLNSLVSTENNLMQLPQTWGSLANGTK